MKRQLYLYILISMSLFVGCASSEKVVEISTPVRIQPPAIKDTLRVSNSPVVAIAPVDSVSGTDSALIVPDRPLEAVKTNSSGDTVVTAVVNLRKGTVAINVTPAAIDTTVKTRVAVKPEIIHKLTFFQRIGVFFIDLFWWIIIVAVIVLVWKLGIWKKVKPIVKVVELITRFL